MNPLAKAIQEVMADRDLNQKYPKGITAPEVLTEIRNKRPDAFPLCTWLDVHDEMKNIYGLPRTSQ